MTEVTTMNFGKIHSDVTLPTLDKYDVGVLVRAYLMSETGRPNKTLVPPQSTRQIRTGLALEIGGGATLTMHTPIDLILRSLFVIPKFQTLDCGEELTVLLYNGSHQSYYVCHEDPIARLVLVASMYMKVGEMEI